MDDSNAPESKPASPWFAAVTAAMIALLIAAVGGAVLRDKMLSQVQEAYDTQTAEREKLASKIAGMQSSLTSLANQPKAEGGMGADATQQLTDATAKIDTLSVKLEEMEQRLQLLEKAAEHASVQAPVAAPAPVAMPVPVAMPAPSPAPAPVAPVGEAALAALKLAVISGKPYAAELVAWNKLQPESDTGALTEFSATGVPSETAVLRELREALNAASAAPVVDDTSLAGKLNTHLKGLVSIKKHNEADGFARLREESLRGDIDSLIREVERLDTAAQVPFAAWLKKARSRQAALDAAAKLTISVVQ